MSVYDTAELPALIIKYFADSSARVLVVSAVNKVCSVAGKVNTYLSGTLYKKGMFTDLM